MGKKVFIEGMSCAHCVKHVTNALNELDGITRVIVDLASKTAIIEGSVPEEAIKAAIEDVGYEVVKVENE
jgi:copper chaperone